MNEINYLIFYHNFYNTYLLLLILYLAFYRYKIYDIICKKICKKFMPLEEHFSKFKS